MKNGTVLNLTLLSCGVLALVFTLLGALAVGAVFLDSVLAGDDEASGDEISGLPELEQTITIDLPNDTGTLTIDLPAGWLASPGSTTSYLGNSEEAMDLMDTDMQALSGEQRGMRIILHDADETPNNPVAFLEEYGQFIPHGDVNLGEPQDMTLAGNDAAVVAFEVPGDSPYEGQIWAIQATDDDGIRYISILATAADFPAFALLSEAIIDSVTLTPAADDE